MRRVTISLKDDLYRQLQVIRGNKIQEELRSVSLTEVVNEYLAKALKQEG